MATLLFVVFVVGLLSFIVVQLCARLIHHSSWESIVFSEAKDKEQERMDRLESRKAIVSTVSKSKRGV